MKVTMTYCVETFVSFLAICSCEHVDSQSTNLAFGKLTHQTGTYDGQKAGRAVDGQTDPQHCAHPDNPTGEGAEWWVDLGTSYRVQRIVIVNTCDGVGYSRLTNFVLSVGPTLDTLSPCGPEFTGDVGAGASVTIDCDLVGRFVNFRRLRGTEVHLVTLCEVEVYGQTPYDCNLCPPGVECSTNDGCSQCQPGKTPPACVHDCDPGSYGINCSSTCGRCRIPSECAPENGVCSGGCQLWWAGDKCDVNIVRPDRTTETARISDVTNSSLKVTWQQLTSVPRDYRQYYSYSISYKPDYDTSFTVGPAVDHIDSEYDSVWITGLEYYREYDVRVTPYREMDGSSESGVIYPITSRYTACGYPDSPNDVRALSFAENDREKIIILWNDVRGNTIRSRCAGKSSVRVEYRLEGTTDWTQIELDLSATEYVIEPPGGTYQVRVALVNTEGLATASDVQSVTIQAPTVLATDALSYTSSNIGALSSTSSSETEAGPTRAGSQGVDITTIVTAVVIIVVAAVTAIVITVLVLRHRKAQHAQRNSHDKELHTYENQSVPITGQHQPPNQTSDPAEYEEVPSSVEAQYQGMDATTRERPTSDDAYARIPAATVEDVAQVEEQYQEVDVTSREPPRGIDDYDKIQIGA